MDAVKDAFQKVKQDIDSIKSNIQSIKNQLDQFQQALSNQQTNNHSNPTHNLTELNKISPQAVKTPNNEFSTGNWGVPTNKPTNQQTNQRTGNEGVSPSQRLSDSLNKLTKASEILASLDELKKEVRFKFKRLTEQEMVVFSTIYSLEEQGLRPDYSLLAETLNLTEISIRDYIRKITIKGIPVDKIKENNNKITLSISPDLKRIASLQTILQLRKI